MKKALLLSASVFLLLCLAGQALAESGTKDECVAKAREAAAMISEKGLDAALGAINDQKGPFVWKDTYVFLMDLDGNIVGHPFKPELIGKNMLKTADKNGKMFFAEFVTVAKGKGEGWVDYMWPKPGEEALSEKTSYIYRVPGQDLMVGAGIYK